MSGRTRVQLPLPQPRNSRAQAFWLALNSALAASYACFQASPPPVVLTETKAVSSWANG